MAQEDITASLFADILPRSPQQDLALYQAQRDKLAAGIAGLEPGRGVVFSGVQAAQDLGRSLGAVGKGVRGLMGMESTQDMQDKLSEQIRAGGADILKTEGLGGYLDYLANSYAQAGMTDKATKAKLVAEKLAQQEESIKSQIELRKAQSGEIETRSKKAEFSAAQEEKLRTELSALGPNASEKDIINVVTKYGSPDKILQVLQNAENVRLQKAQTAALRAQKASMLPAGLQKDELKDLETIDSFTAQSEALKPSILNLTPDSKGARKLELGPAKNLKYAAQNLSGNSTEESRAYEALKSAVDTAVNLQVSAEKGVQTDKDVLRFANALIAAFGRNDTQATLEALKRYNEAVEKAKGRVQTRIDSRRKSQGVESYFGTSSSPLGSMENPIILK